jgi:DNA-directed RNA polymerase subunit M/transcription elongation factor TFIIS
MSNKKNVRITASAGKKKKPRKPKIDESDSSESEVEELIKNTRQLKLDFPDVSKLKKETIAMFNLHIRNIKISTKIEQGLLQFARDYCSKSESIVPVYLSKRTDLIRNMDAKSDIGNKNFVKNIKDKTLKLGDTNITDYDDVAYLKPHEMFPEKWEELVNRRIIREEKSKNIATSDLYKCGKCGARKAIIAPPVQTRSADEPMTTYITCQNCSHVFRL